MKFIRKHISLNEARSSGFSNPFDDEYNDVNIESVDYLDNDSLYDKNSFKINNVSLWNSNTTNKVVYKHNKMFAGQFFDIGDIVETAPVKTMHKRDLYSDRIRECAFLLDSEKGLYGLPLGYAVCYRNSKETGLPGNIEYEYNEDDNTIIIKAISKIKKGQELIFAATDDDFANELLPGQFDYSKNTNALYAVSNIKVI